MRLYATIGLVAAFVVALLLLMAYVEFRKVDTVSFPEPIGPQYRTDERIFNDARGTFWIAVKYGDGVGIVYLPIEDTHEFADHWEAVFRVYRVTGNEQRAWPTLIKEFPGTYTGWKCWEDKPADLVTRALG